MAEIRRVIQTALVTGASGMIGATLIRKLLRKGIRVYGVVRKESAKTANLPKESARFTVIRADMDEFGTLSAPEKVDAVFHLAWAGAAGKGRNSSELQTKNVEDSLAFLRRARSLGASVFVGAGSQAEYGRTEEVLTPGTPCAPETEYGKAKYRLFSEGSALAKELGIDFVWPRFLSVYGPYDNDYSMVMSAVNTFLKRGRFSCTLGEQVWDYVYSGDAAEILYRLALFGESGRAYIVSGGKARTLRSYIEAIRDAVDHDLPIGFGEIPYYDHQVMHLTGDMTETIKITGYRPGTAFEKGIQKTVRWAGKKG
ncbi:MAG: NAD(P)-dependent oxidoreductase [Lachnospiraceae bacterium]|nr:NAD(P)-dependent oxidoreductase [Lachnospiraceae bacterium]